MSILNSNVYELRSVDGVDIFLWNLEESLSDLCGLLVDVSLLESEPYVTFKSEKRKREWVAVRVLLEQVCQKPVAICYASSGKPFLNPSDSYFSVSHTKDVVGIALAKMPVGIDLEQIGARPLQLSSRFLVEDEFNPFSVPYSDLMATFMWSAKESVYKLFGDSNLGQLTDIHLEIVDSGTQYSEFKAEIPCIGEFATVRCYRYDTFVLTVATSA